MPGDQRGEPLFPVANRELYKQWTAATSGTEVDGITLKDLRRASLYHLGHHTAFSGELTLLMKHARHKEPQTTMLYLRRPDEDGPPKVDELDFSA
jgi:integrase